MGNKNTVFAIVAGETSGDLLGADLIRGLKKRFPHAIFEGIGGPQMIGEGFKSLHEMERLSVMGFIEPLKRLPELLRIRNGIVKRYQKSHPLVFIGIDSPDFNSHIEHKLHNVGIKTVHYVSPSVWAWRQGRIKKIKKSIDLMLTLLPFESEFYEKNSVPVTFVGHPLANQIPKSINKAGAREKLQLDVSAPVLCLMPGSRAGEVELMASLFLATAKIIAQEIPKLQVIIPAANESRYVQIKTELEKTNMPNITLLQQQSHLAMEASDSILLASGTTALEGMLFKKPMVVSYRLGWLTYRLVSSFIKTPFISIPNLLAGKMLVPELVQSDATIPKLTEAVRQSLTEDQSLVLKPIFNKLHDNLALDSSDLCASAIAKLVKL